MRPARYLGMVTVFAALLVAGCADIDRQLYSLSETVAPADRVTGQRSLNFASRQSQIAQSNRQADAMLAEMQQEGRPINEKLDAAQYARLQRIFTRVHAVSHLKDEPWKVYLLPSNDFNAFVTGGSYVFVNKGLMDTLRSDDEVAAVLGHELAHVSANHVYERNAHAIAATLRGSKSVKEQTFQTAFTYNNEEEADEIGTLYAALAGYNPVAAANVWKRMYESQGDFSLVAISHPTNSDRYRKNMQLASTYQKYYTPGKINPRAAEILADNEVFGNRGGFAGNTNIQPGQGGGLLAVLETTAGAYGKHTQAKNEQQRQALNQQFITGVNQSMGIAQPRVEGTNVLWVPVTYRGDVPVRNMTLMAQLGGATATKTAGGAVLQPGQSFEVPFDFPSLNLPAQDLRQLKVAVVHAEP